MHGETAPPAADFEHLVGRLQAQLAAEHIVFADLRLLEVRPRLIPIGRGIGHGRIQPQREEVIAEIVVLFDVAAAGAAAVRT